MNGQQAPVASQVTRRRFVALAPLSLAGAALLAACGGAPAAPPAATTAPTTAPSAPAPTAAPTPAATTAPTAAPTTAAAATPATGATPSAAAATTENPFGAAAKKGGAYTVSVGGLYPHVFVPYSYYGSTEFYTCKLLFTPLVFLDAKWQKFGPALATSWAWTPDNKQLKMQLRKGVKFHDGTELTAKDVEFTMKLMARKEDYPAVQDVTLLEGGQDYKSRKSEQLPGVEVVDDYTIQFNLTAPSLVFLLNLSDTGVVPMHAFPPDALTSDQDSNEGPKMFDFFKSKPIGTGPFKLKDFDLKTHITFETHKDYWKGAPNLDGIIFRAGMQSAAVIAALESGELDGSYLGLQDAATEKDKPQFNIVANDSLANEQMLMIATEKPYMNVKVRQALLTALDRNALIKTVTYGFGKIAPSIMMWPQLFPNPNLPKYDYDPAMAKQLLKDGNWDPSRKLIFGALAAQGAPNNTYAAMINMWKAVGVDVEYKPFDPANSTVVWKANPHEWDVMQTSYAWLAYDPTSTFQEFGCDVPGNYPHYCNQDYDSTMKEAIRTGDQDKAVELFRKVQTTVATDLPYMPIWIEPEIWAINKRMHGGVLGRGPLNDVLPELWWKE